MFSADFAQAASGHAQQAYPEYQQYAHFPTPLKEYPPRSENLMDTLKARATPFNIAASIIFILAIVHTFLAGFFMKLAHKYEHEHEKYIREKGLTAEAKPQDDAVSHVSFKSMVFHFLGEVEAIFGLWVVILGFTASYFYSWDDFKLYIGKDRNFVEPMFVVVIMAIAASRPVLRFAENTMARLARFGQESPSAWWLTVMIVAPILGSFITEPAAMTIGALLLSKKFFKHHPKPLAKYGSLGLLFVNVSVGGTLTHFAAPPVLMVASAWSWDTMFMATHFGWKAIIGIIIATFAYYLFFRKELNRVGDAADGREDGVEHALAWHEREDNIPLWVTIHHLGFLAWTVFNAHDPVLFIGGFLFFLAFVLATGHHQNAISMKGPLLVGFFLGGLIIHGGCQAWWIEPIILALPDSALMLGSTVLTAFNDNAAITYLASQVSEITPSAKYAVVAGAVTGGGLTVIANAPNPAGQSILAKHFEGGVSPIKLLGGAIIPTIIMYACFALLPSIGGSSHGAEQNIEHSENVDSHEGNSEHSDPKPAH